MQEREPRLSVAGEQVRTVPHERHSSYDRRADAPVAKGVKTNIAIMVEHANRVLIGKEHQVRLALACMIAHGHLLIEDLPGVGKTILAHLLARLFGLDFQRIQFTSDLLPADVLGYSVYSRNKDAFAFHAGPVFTNVVLADEVNRATPKAQSALLEAMEERQVTVEGETRELPNPFFVIATQNPFSQVGTFPLPESQLDRFMMRLTLGFPDREAERELLRGRDRRELLEELKPVQSPAYLLKLQKAAYQVTVSEALMDYLQRLLAHTRGSQQYPVGLSPRAGLCVLQCARVWALIHGRTMVLPEDLQAVLPGTIAHRLVTSEESGVSASVPERVAERLIREVPIP